MTTQTPRSRQKSCIPCANAKRRCDMKNPVCSRCASKFLLCEYKSAPHSAPQPPTPISQDDTIMDFNPSASAVGQLLVSELNDSSMGLTFPTGIDGTATTRDILDDDFFYAYDNRLQANDCPEVGVMDRERIRYLVRQLKSYPEKLFRSGRTPFIHPQSYQPVMPQSLQDACCAAALYSGKNETNEAMVWEIISAKASQILTPLTSWAVSEHLSSLQSLIIFQIIRLFDGDIKQRADAEMQESILTSWTDRLSQRTGVTLSSSSDTTSTSYESWLFTESICRTIIISLMVQAMFSIQKQGFCTLVSAVSELSFTAQEALWEAPSAVHWEKCWKERERWRVEKMDFEGVLGRGNVGEVDEMGILMLVCYKGVEGVNEWILRGGWGGLIE